MNITIVTSEYPPSRIANATRPSLLAREMVKQGHAVEIITPRTDEENPKNLRSNIGKSGEKIYQIVDPVKKWRKRFRRNRVVNTLLDRLWPDPEILWIVKAGLYLRKKKEKSTVIALINPASMLMLRWLVPRKRHFFVYDYLESVTPFRKQIPHHFAFHRWLSTLLACIEKMTLARTDKIIFTCSENREAYLGLNLCSKEKSFYLPHYSDPNPYVKKQISCEDKMIISYFGYFNSERTPEFFLKGISNFFKKESSAINRVTVNCYGNGLGLHESLVAELDLENVVNHCEPLNFDVMLSTSATSHLLLLVAAAKHKLFFPSKLTEYIAACRPILAILPIGTETTAILNKSGRGEWTCSETDTSSISECLEQAWKRFLEGTLGKSLPTVESTTTPYYTSIWEDILKH